MQKLSVHDIIILACCLCFSYVIIFHGVFAEKEIPATKFEQSVGPTMHFLYCYSCGYKKAFEDYVNILGDKYPQIKVTGANYDPPGLNLYLSNVVFFLKVGFILLIVSSFDIFGKLGIQTPSWWHALTGNKLYSCMMIFFLGNMVEGQLVSSGAFEIMLNNVPVWSKLETGRVPSPPELFQIIDNQLQFTEKIQENPDFVK